MSPPSIADQVYVSGLPKDVTEEDIVAHFGSIGMLKIDKKRDLAGSKKKIWLYKDKATGELKVWFAPANLVSSSSMLQSLRTQGMRQLQLLMRDLELLLRADYLLSVGRWNCHL